MQIGFQLLDSVSPNTKSPASASSFFVFSCLLLYFKLLYSFLQVLALVFVRKLMDFLFTKRELSWLDDLMPESKKKKLEDAEKEVSQNETDTLSKREKQQEPFAKRTFCIFH